MLVELRIRNFAIIEEAALAFGPGLNTLSGETGAGKTIIMTALGLLLGGRASPDLVRSGAREAVVEGIFELEGESPPAEAAEWLDAEGGRELLIRRVIADGGRSRVTVNGGLATVQSLSRLATALVQIYGQHEQQSLMLRETHQQILDRHAGLESELAAYAELYERAIEIRARLEEFERRERERANSLELARFRLNELEQAALAPGEDEVLAAERNVLANATRLAAAAGDVEQALYGADGAAIDVVSQAQTRLSEAASLDPSLKDVLEMIAAAHANLEEAVHSLRAYAAKIEADPARLEQIETRLQELLRLKRKYGGTIESAIDTLKRSRAEVAELENAAANRDHDRQELARTLNDLAAAARKASARRSSDAIELKRRMEAELKTLGMRNAVFAARVVQTPATEGAPLSHDGLAFGPAGCDTVEFSLAPNLGQPPMPLARIVSGGELSRVMLALKCLEAQRRGVATMIFDEVDAGIGGAIAEVVGRKLKQLARFHQVLCVTHLAQVAAFADSHFMIEKEERRGSTRSHVFALAQNERPAEIARMLGGDQANEKFVRAARELLDRAQS